jgi:8-hydroxy-5-deazaflavin:NADPH oxidoreductase
MRISIIGAGNIGGTLTRQLTSLGHEVTVANSRGPETLTELTSSTGAACAPVSEVAIGAELVIVSIPQGRVPDLPIGFLDRAGSDVVVIDTGNYYPQQRDGHITEIENGLTESRWVSNVIGYPVFKAFNGISASNIVSRARPTGAPDRMAIPVAGDDAAAKRVVMDLIEEMGFDAVDAGNIDESWRQQPGSPVYGLEADADRVRLALSQAQRERAAAWRA